MCVIRQYKLREVERYLRDLDKDIEVQLNCVRTLLSEKKISNSFVV